MSRNWAEWGTVVGARPGAAGEVPAPEALSASARRCLRPDRCPYARRSPDVERLLAGLLPGDPELAWEILSGAAATLARRRAPRGP